MAVYLQAFPGIEQHREREAVKRGNSKDNPSFSHREFYHNPDFFKNEILVRYWPVPKKYNHITNQLVLEAYDLCFETNRLRCINDAIHLKFAEKYGSKLITFDRDFKKFRPYANIEIEILD
jgi:predicted nucleic acid-binding protein